MKDKEEKKQRIAAVDRTVDILSALGTGQNRTIRDLGNELNITKSTLHRLLQTLEDRGMVKKDAATEKYALGYKILELSADLKKDHELREIAYDHMKSLSEEHGDTVQLAIIENDEIIIVETVEGTNDLRVFAQPGQKYPVTYGNFGKVFLSEYSDEEIRNHISSMSQKEAADFLKELTDAKEQQVAVGIDSPIEGAVSIAVPIVDSRGNIIASLSLAGVKTDRKIEKIAAIRNSVIETGQKISRDIK